MIGMRKIAMLLGMALALLAPNLARADYPERTITMVVCFGAGGGTDIAARLISTPLAEALGRPVVVENRVGAGGNLGINAVQRAARMAIRYWSAPAPSWSIRACTSTPTTTRSRISRR